MSKISSKLYKRYIRIGSLLALLIVIVSGIIGYFIGIPGIMHSAAPEQNTGKSVDVTIYLTSETLGKIFQDRVNQMLDKAVSGSVNTLPAQSRASVLQMANAILQPSASLTGIIPQQDALNTSLRLYLYPGDPHPIDAQMQIMFRAISLSTMQVSVKPLPGSPSLASGPVASIRVPLGQLTTMGTTPACGMTALAIHLQFPLSLSSTSSAASQTATPTVPSQQTQIQKPQDQNSAVNVSVGIPAASLDQIGNSVGSMPMNGAMSANNIHILVQSNTLSITSDLYVGALNIGSTRTTVETAAANGNLTMHVLNTSVQLLHAIPFPYNLYNQQLEATLNAKLQAAFAHKFSVTQATIGSSNQVPCAPESGLLLTGFVNLG